MNLFDRFHSAPLWGPALGRAGRAPANRRLRLELTPLEDRNVPAAAPTISPIGKQFDQVNTVLAVSFTVSERGLPPSTLVVTATSGNTAVVPDAGLKVLGDTSRRTLMITPAGNQAGEADITLNVRDPNGVQIQKVVPVLVSPPPTLPFTDSFNRSDAVFLGVGWAEDAGDFAVQATQGAPTTPKTSVATEDGLIAPEVAVQADVSVAPGQSAGLVARYTGPTDKNMYVGRLVAVGSGFQAQLIRNVNGIPTTLVSKSVGSGTGTLRLEAAGPSLKLFLNNALVAFVSDSVLTAPGSVGVQVTGGAGFDNFSAAALPRSSPTLPFNDNFNGATDQQLNTNWVNQAGNFQVAGGVATGLAALDVAALNGLRAPDVVVQAGVSPAAGQTVGLVARYSGPKDQNMYVGRLVVTGTGTKAELVRNFNGVQTRLFSRTVTGPTTGVLRLEVVGPSLKLFLNNTLIAFADDDVLKTGSVGFASFSGASLDNFSAGTLTLTTASLPFSDTFNSATNQQISNSWLNRLGNFQVASGVATGLGPVNVATLNGVSATNVVQQADVNVIGGAGWSAGLVSRYSGSGDRNMYFAGLVNTGSGFQVQVRRYINGTWKTLAAKSVGAGTGRLKFVTSGNSLTVLVNNVQVLALTDNGIAGAGLVGMLASTGATVDNFSAS
jgi:hypothetical protein